MTNKLNNIQKSLDNTNFTNFLNQCYLFLLKSEDIDFVMDKNLVMQEVIVLIKFLYEQQISRVPYDTITSKVNEFNDYTDETMENLSDSFDFFFKNFLSFLFRSVRSTFKCYRYFAPFFGIWVFVALEILIFAVG